LCLVTIRGLISGRSSCLGLVASHKSYPIKERFHHFLQVHRGWIQCRTPLGEKFDAKFDGKYYLIEDDPWHTMVSVKLINPNTVEQAKSTRWQGRLRRAFGKTIHASSKSKEDGGIKDLGTAQAAVESHNGDQLLTFRPGRPSASTAVLKLTHWTAGRALSGA
jgi:hypothetical protein